VGEIRVGTTGWTDKTLLQSGWYPPEARTPAARLRYYASRFPLVEVDSTYYFPPSEANSRAWVERTPPGFVFDVKAFSLLTNHPTKPTALFKDLRPNTEKKNVYLDDLAPEVVDQIWDRFLSALLPLYEAGRLGALLFQFPPWFAISRANKQYVLGCAKRAQPLPISVEFRNKTWLSERNRRETLDFLEGHGLAYVCVDMPQGFGSSVPPVAAATAELAIVRFHGRNAKEWESGVVQRRFRYLYKEEELAGWVPRIAGLAEGARTTHVLMNNCYRDYAQTNGRQIAALLQDHGLAVTPPS
jgi:uncharacterized protein YecE (DUF72 family)